MPAAQDREERWYLLRIRPYVTLEKKIEGASITLVDIDSIKRGREQLLRRYVELVGATPGEPAECRDRTERYWDMLTGEIPGEERQEQEQHSKGCRYCGPKLESMRVAASYGLVLPIGIALLLNRRDELIRGIVSQPVAARTPAPARAWRRCSQVTST